MLPALTLDPSSSSGTPQPLTPSFEPADGLPFSTLDWSRPVSELLRTGTKRAHEDVEHSPGAARLAKGELSREEYARWCVGLWSVYDALETALEEHSYNPTLSPIYHPSLLSRAPALSADISTLLHTSASWQAHPVASALLSSPPPALKAYVARLTQLAASEPERLLAHAYVRYLGDLSGGQIIRRRLAKHLSLSSPASAAGAEDDSPPPGLSFFSFSKLGGAGVADAAEMRRIKEWFRHGMDEGVGEDEALKRQVVEEANEAFVLNAGLFEMLDELPALHGTVEPEAGETRPTKTDLPVEEVYTPLAKRSSAAAPPAAEPVAPQQSSNSFPLSSVLSFLIALCLAHFLLVTMGFTGQRGWDKFELVQGWVKGKLDL